MSEEKEALVGGLLKWLILGVLGLTAVSAIVAVALPALDNVLVVHSLLDQIIVGCAYFLAVPAVMGLICIFWKGLRLPTAIVTGLYLVGFLCAICIGKSVEKVSYMQHKEDVAQSRYAVVTKHEFRPNDNDLYKMELQFTDDGTTSAFEQTQEPLLFYHCAEEGDTVRVQYIKGACNVDFIVGLRKVMNN